MATHRDNSLPWYLDTRYARFWTHYESCCAWMNGHHDTVARIQQADRAAAWKQWAEYSMHMYHTYQHQAQHATKHEQGRQCNNKPRLYSPRDQADKSSVVCNETSTKTFGELYYNEPENLYSAKTSRSREKQKRKNAASPRQSRPSSRKGRKERKRQPPQQEPREEDSDEDDDEYYEEADIMCDIPQSSELLSFLAASAAHRKQRDARKRAAEREERQSKREDDLDKNYLATSQAPRERPGQKRTSEMKSLYGKGAAMIHGMETAMQLTFDRNMDLKQPKHWPNLPLNIQFN